MNNLEVRNINFQGSSLLAIQEKKTGKVFTAINNVLRGLGFDEVQTRYQRDKWNADSVISKGVQKFSHPSQSGGIQETYCIDIMKLPLALAKINITPKIQSEMPELTEKLEVYQDRCADALAREFNVYGSADNEYKLPGSYKEALQQLLITVIEKEELEISVKVKEQQIAEMEPKVSYYDLVLQSPGLLSMTDIAKDYGKSARWMNEKLHEFGVQYFQGGVWFLYQKYAGYGYTKTNTFVYPNCEGISCGRPHTYWTQKGRLFLYGVLKEHGIYPIIEHLTGQLCLVEM